MFEKSVHADKSAIITDNIINLRRELVASKFDKVTIISQSDHVFIVENKKGNRFSVVADKLQILN